MKLNRRIFRELKENLVRYLGLFFLIVLSVMIIVGYSSSSDSIINSAENAQKENRLEDGHISVFKPLDTKVIEQINTLGIKLQKEYYIDYEVEKSKTLRVFRQRNEFNRLTLLEGKQGVVVDEHFATINDYTIGKLIHIGNKELIVSGYGISPEYTMVIAELSDMVTNHEAFGVAYVSDEIFEKLDQANIIYGYAYAFNNPMISKDKQKQLLEDMQELVKNGNVITSFYKTENNQRVNFYKEKTILNKNISIMLGIILIIILAYIIAISVIHIIEKDSAVIGTLYSMGYVKREIVRHYMALPLIIVSVASALGSVLGLSVINKIVMKTPSEFFNFPQVQTVYAPYMIVLGLVIPIGIALIVNEIMLNKKLGLSVLKLLRKEGKREKGLKLSLQRFKFLTKFKMRITLQEARTYLTLFVELIFVTFLLVMGFGMKDSLGAYPDDVRNSVKNEYTYYLKAPYEIKDSAVEKVVDVKGTMGDKKTFNITLRGIDEDNQFYNLRIPDSETGVYVSSTVSEKLKVQAGDQIKFKNQFNDEVYSLKVIGVYDYVNGLYIFISDAQLNHMIGYEKGYFNVLLSDKSFNIPSEYLLKKLTVDDVVGAADNMVAMMKAMIFLLVGAAIAISVISLYLILKIMIDRSHNNIALIKIFGYQNGEINRIFLDFSLLIIIFGTLVSLPISQKLLGIMWPAAIGSVQGFIFFKIAPMTYLYVSIIILGTYIISSLLLKRHLSRISYVELLKERE